MCAQYVRGIARYQFIPESESLLLASWRSQLASRKAVGGDPDAEESETASPGTDPERSGQVEQERHTEAESRGRNEHIFTTFVANKLLSVDAAEIRGRNTQLPGEVCV